MICMFSPQDEDDLTDLMTRVFQEGLEGLVLKDVNVSHQDSCLLNCEIRIC